MSKYRHGLALLGDVSKGMSITQTVVNSFGEHGSSTMIIDKNGDEFLDQFVEAMKDERPNHFIVCVFNNPENFNFDDLNTITDDNKALTYKGEKTNLKPNTRVVIVTGSMKAMTPAHFSRLGMILVN